MLVGTFCVLTLLDRETYGETMKSVVTIVVGFYFGTQFQKGKTEEGEKNERTLHG